MTNSNETQFRAGFIAIAGLPNVGKSTLLNTIIGEKVAIVSHRPQTTRNAIYGIKTTDTYQAIFVDTPGFHSPKTVLNKAIMQQVTDSFAIVDVVCVLVEAGSRRGKDFERLIEAVNNLQQPKILVVTKVDKVKKEYVFKTVEEIFPLCDFKEVVPVSAFREINIDTLLNTVAKYLPENVMQYEADLITTQPEKFLISEYIREQIFMNLREEVPYDVLIDIESLEETDTKIVVSAVIYVNRESQKGILIGERGLMMKKIGEEARLNVESFFGKKVFLELWVKVKENWINKSDSLGIQGLNQ